MSRIKDLPPVYAVSKEGRKGEEEGRREGKREGQPV